MSDDRNKGSITYGALGTVEEIKNHAKETTELVVRSVGKLVISDGYHTMDELYKHRITLYIALCRDIHANNFEDIVWRSKLHADGSSFDGWFILGIYKEKGKQITYHLPLSKWDECAFAETLERGPEWDGHTPTDVLKRLSEL